MHPLQRIHRHRHPVNIRYVEHRTLGERVADRVAEHVGSWPFIIVQSVILAAWIAYNGWVAVRILHGRPFDPYPFILLNLALSFQAAYTGPVVMMSENRQAARDREMAEHDYRVNRAAFDHLLWQNRRLLELCAAAGITVEESPPPGPVDDGTAGSVGPAGTVPGPGDTGTP